MIYRSFWSRLSGKRIAGIFVFFFFQNGTLSGLRVLYFRIPPNESGTLLKKITIFAAFLENGEC